MSAPRECPACGVEERCGCECSEEDKLRAEVNFLNTMWDNARENYQKALKDIESLRAEVSRLRGLLREAGDQMSAATYINTDSITLGDIVGRIDAELEQP